MEQGGVRIKLKVIPNAPRNEVVGWRAGALTIKLTAPALRGRANRQLCEYLAELFGLSTVDVSLLRGENSRQKVVHLSGITAAEAGERLKTHLD